jgi:hypothetical protein
MINRCIERGGHCASLFSSLSLSLSLSPSLSTGSGVWYNYLTLIFEKKIQQNILPPEILLIGKFGQFSWNYVLDFDSNMS